MVETNRRREGRGPIARLTTETKQAFKTTEFWAMVAIVAGILVAAALIGEGESGASDEGDVFNAWRAWLLITIVGSAYMVSRGLAKSGSRDPYWADLSDEIPSGRDRESDRA
jgi:hypothetical protein